MRRNVVFGLVIVVVTLAWFSQSSVELAGKTKGAKQVETSFISDKSIVRIAGEIPHGGKCNLESVNGKLFGEEPHAIEAGSVLTMQGWALCESIDHLPIAVWIRLTGPTGEKFFALAQSGIPRPDVQKHFDLRDKLIGSGFRLAAQMQEIEKGTYAVELLIKSPSNWHVCNSGRRILVQ